MVILRDHINRETAERLDVDEINFNHDDNDEHEPPARDDVVPLLGSIEERASHSVISIIEIEIEIKQ